MTQLRLEKYFSLINLDEEFISPSTIKTSREQNVDELLNHLLQEPNAPKDVEIPSDYANKRSLLRGLLNIREPRALDGETLEKMDTLLQTELKDKDVVEVDNLDTVSQLFPNNPFTQSDKLILWKGDITKLKANAIVNAANKHMLGCFQPLHACIDNAIHSAAGPQLRNDCEIIMSQQGELEDTGNAKITRAYNLPSKYILHTVGPIVPKGTTLTQQQKEELSSCYISCLELASEIKDIKSIAFCAISTGVFRFPKSEAAYIAINTVNKWLEAHLNHFEKVIFNVFSDDDYKEYLKVFMQ
ncbi:protein-ADP-ribose hydrolase [Priestia endophytica]|uniref:protein-ADP-ribose hydrolase n=1 Tax=Priestia endophytica TaxID=135735 RepID=UPI003D298B1A